MEQSLLCRICLNTGEMPIFNNEYMSNFQEDICIFGNIQVEKDDGFPQLICNTCITLLKNAILFRNTARKSNQLLKNTSKATYCEFSPQRNILRPKESNIDQVDNGEKYSNNGTITQLNEFADTQNAKILDNNEQDCEVKSTDSLQIDCFRNENKNYNEMIMIIVSDNEDTHKNISVINSQESDEYTCTVCNMDFESDDDYQQHVKTKYHINTERRANKVSCEICEKLIATSKYDQHIGKHNHDELQKLIVECRICNIQFESIENFESHNGFVHGNATKSLDDLIEPHKRKCNICDKFVVETYFRSHLKVHGCKIVDSKSLQSCPYCNKAVRYSYLAYHIRKIHKTKNCDGTDNYVCDKCGKVFKTKSGLNLHILTHGTEFKYKCDYCPYRGLHKALLNIHVRTHTGDYKYKCPKCPVQCLTKSNLTKHLKRHIGPVHFKCSACDKRFYSQLELNRHYDIRHLGIKNHICNICGKAFGYRNGMMCHQLKVHKRKRLTSGKGRLPTYLQVENSSVTK